MKQYVRLLLAVFVLSMATAVSTTPAFAQGGGATTSLSGTVTDTSGAIIPGANVSVKSNATSTEFTAVTNESGFFTVPSIDPGGYTVTVTLMGFKTAVLNDVRVNAATPATIKVALEVGGLEETVVVQGGSEIIQTQSAAVTATIDTNQILKLPTGSRSALEFVTSLPGVNTPAGQPRFHDQWSAAELDQHHHRRRQRPGQLAEDDGRLLRARQPAAGRDRGSHGQLGRPGRGEHRPGRGADPLRHPLGQQQLQRQRLLLPAPLQARRHRLVQQPGRHRAGPRRSCSSPEAASAVRSSSRGCSTAVTRRSSSSTTRSRARPVRTPRTGRSCTRPREQGLFRWTSGGVTRAGQPAAASPRRTATCPRSIRRSLVCSPTSTHAVEQRRADGDRPHRSAAAADARISTTARGSPSTRRGASTCNLDQQPSPVDVDELHRPGVDAGHDQQPRAELPRLPEHRQPASRTATRCRARCVRRSAPNLVNELRIGRSGGATLFSPEIGPDQFQGTSVADQGGFLLDINGDFLGITNADVDRQLQRARGRRRGSSRTR